MHLGELSGHCLRQSVQMPDTVEPLFPELELGSAADSEPLSVNVRADPLDVVPEAALPEPLL